MNPNDMREEKKLWTLEEAYAEGCSDGREQMRMELEKNVGMLRQWLNEDRITDSKKMVTNEQILSMLNFKL